MILSINTVCREKIELALFDKCAGKHFEFKTLDQSADLVRRIKEIINSSKISLKDIRAILVNCGPGSFTGVRVGVTVANTLAWSLDIPVYGYKDGKEQEILEKILKYPKSKFLKIALPYYE